MSRLTRRQMAVLRAIYRFGIAHGYGPSLRDIGDELGIGSTNGISDHLRALERKGAIVRAYKIARSIVITEAALRLLDPDLAEKAQG